MSSINSMQKAAVRPGDFHLRSDARKMFGNYVELSPVGGTNAFAGTSIGKNVRRSAMFVATPVYEEPKLWELELLFSAPYGTGSPPAPAVFPPVAASPWIPAGFNFDVNVTIMAALDRDKYVETKEFTLRPLDFGEPNTFPLRFQHASQLSISVELVGTTSEILGVQASAWEVHSGARDAFGSATLTEVAQTGASQLFLAPNALRRQFIITNLGSDALYVGFADAVNTPTGSPPHNLTMALLSYGDSYESPRDCWQGAVAGVWASAGGPTDFALVTEAV